jgi:hypothetical protein
VSPTAFAILVLGVAVLSPALILLLGELPFRHGVWVQERPYRRKVVFLAIALVYAAIAVFLFLNHREFIHPVAFGLLSVGMAVVAFIEGRAKP